MATEITKGVSTVQDAPPRQPESIPEVLPTDLRPAHLRFAMAFLQNGGNIAAAGRAAGYKVKGKGCDRVYEIRRDPLVDRFIRQELNKLFQAERMTVAEIVARLARIGRADPRKLRDEDGRLKPIHELTEAEACIIRGFEEELKFDGEDGPPTAVTKVKLADPVPALRTLAQIENLLGQDTATVNIFVDLDRRLDSARKRHRERAAVDAKVVSEQ